VTPPDPLPRLVADLIGLGVGLVPGAGGMVYRGPTPAARAAVAAAKPELDARRADVLRVWPLVAAGGLAAVGAADPAVCRSCGAATYAGVGSVTAADVAAACAMDDTGRKCPHRRRGVE
jgi:hypothetical protein